MGNLLLSQTFSLLEASAESTKEFLFVISPQTLYTAMFTMLAVFMIFTAFGKLLYGPVKDMMEKRSERIRSDIEKAANDKKSAEQVKIAYENKLKEVQKEADEILAAARKKALSIEYQIVGDAKEEANRIFQRAQNEIQLEKAKMRDEIKSEMIHVATAMAARFVTVSISEQNKLELIDQTLNEMGDDTWLN